MASDAAVSCDFFRGGCTHEQIFVSEYKRTNRTKRTKILRCFPHCCPEHVNRSYCGSPLSVQVRLPLQRSGREFGRAWTLSHSDVAVFAHFEEAQAEALRVGGEVAYDTVYDAIQTEQTPKGVWIEGGLAHSDLEQNAHVYQINAGARWYYEWESAATKSQRFTRHVLRVYVFERLPASDHQGFRPLRVVAVATSTEFLVVSYRRAPTDGRTDGRTEQRDPQPLLPTAWAVDEGSVTSSVHHGTRPAPRIAHPVVERDSALDSLQAEHKAWEALHADAMLTSKHLAVLCHFLMAVDALPFHSCMTQWSALLYEQLEGERPVRRLESVWAPVDGAQDQVARVVHASARLVGWLLFDRETMGQLRQLLADCAHSLLDKRALRRGFIAAVELLRDRAEPLAGTSPSSSSTSSTLSLVTEEILAVVFQTDMFKPLRPVLIGVLAAPAMHGFQTYVAQVRAMFVTVSKPRLPLQPQSHRGESPFEGTWDLDGNRSAVKSAATTAAGFSLGCAMHFLREWAQVSIRVTGEHSIAVSSSWAAAVGADPDRALAVAMHLTLDRRRRVFRNFPSGLSSMIAMGSQMLGEYRGQVESATSFWVEFASADCTGGGDGFRWVLQFQADGVDEATGGGSSLLVIGSIDQVARLEEGAAPQPQSELFKLSLAFDRCST